MRGRPGLELAREHQPVLVLLDLRPPDMDGEQVLQ
jgi:DNA-binding response OmpR family regulator